MSPRPLTDWELQILKTLATEGCIKKCADKLFINSAGVGIVPSKVDISGSNAKPGDKVILSGSIGDHGIAVISQREGLQFTSSVKSDCAPLNKLVAEML
jgi:hydrogenase expression/formation protein HypE